MIVKQLWPLYPTQHCQGMAEMINTEIYKLPAKSRNKDRSPMCRVAYKE